MNYETNSETGLKNPGLPTEILREVTILKNINHENIIKLRNIFFSKSDIYLVFEYA